MTSKTGRSTAFGREALMCLMLEGSSALGCELKEQTALQLMDYLDLVLEWNKKVNLTAITDGRDFIIKHFVDSLAGVSLLGPSGKLVDVGSGAGFPGLVLKIFYPGLEVCLVESVGKKAQFLKAAAGTLGLEGVEVVCARAEEVGRNSKYREAFDYAVCRAVSELAVVAEYCLPLVKVEGSLVAYKGDKAEEELSRAERAIALLGGTVQQVYQVKLPFLGDGRTLIKVCKQEICPEKYPRRTGVPAKRPLI